MATIGLGKDEFARIQRAAEEINRHTDMDTPSAAHLHNTQRLAGVVADLAATTGAAYTEIDSRLRVLETIIGAQAAAEAGPKLRRICIRCNCKVPNGYKQAHCPNCGASLLFGDNG